MAGYIKNHVDFYTDICVEASQISYGGTTQDWICNFERKLVNVNFFCVALAKNASVWEDI